MTRAQWGPMGWVTLHSVASLYPDRPTSSDRLLMENWLSSFEATITCPTCQGHFRTMVATARAGTDILASKYALVWFVAKAHNSVNVRLGKPQVKTFKDMWARYDGVNWEPTRSNYYRYIAGSWSREQGFDGIRLVQRVSSMKSSERGMSHWRTESDDIRRLLAATPDVLISLTEAETERSRARILGQGPRFALQGRPATGIFAKIIPAHLRS